MKIFNAISQLPTTDLYFRFAAKEMCNATKIRKAYKQHTRFLIETTKAFIIVRYLDKKSLAIIQKNKKHKKVCYIVDDNFEAMFNSDTLLPHYRKRIKKFYEKYHHTILNHTNHVVCPSGFLSSYYQNHEVTILEPYRPSLNQITPKHRKTDTIHNIGWTATHTHINDLLPIIDQIKKFIRENKKCHFHVWIPKKHLPKWLKNCPNLIVHKYIKWEKFQKQMKNIDLDICIHPLQKNTINKCRSINKITEHASINSLGLYPKWFIDIHQLNLPKICKINNKPDSWYNALISLKNKKLYNNTHKIFVKTAKQYNHEALTKQIHFWHSLHISWRA